MPIVSSLRDGARRVFRAPVVLIGATLLTASLALPLHGVLEAGARAAGSDYPAGQWWRQCAAPATGVSRSLETAVTGCSAQVAGLAVSPAVTHPPHPLLIAYLLGCALLLWTFLSGGILDRFARDRPTRSVGFFAACGMYGSRLVRLGLLAALTYWVLFGPVQDLLFGTVFLALVENASPPVQTAVGLGLYALFGALLGGVGLVFDYARVRAVVEDRRSAIGAVLAGWRFVRRRPLGCAGLYAANSLLLLAALAAVPLVTAGVGVGSLIAALLGLGARSAGRLLFYAAETAYFQSQLAHAGYVAAPTPRWPESPAAEALERLG
jgi:hypothetical protein